MKTVTHGSATRKWKAWLSGPTVLIGLYLAVLELGPLISAAASKQSQQTSDDQGSAADSQLARPPAELGAQGAGKGPLPTAPTGLQLTLSPENHVQLTWVDTTKKEKGFAVERHDDQASWARYATVAVDQTSYIDSIVKGGSTYYYRVAAFNQVGSSGYTEPRSVSLMEMLPWLELTNRYLIVEDLWGPIEGSEGRANFGEYCIRGLQYWKAVADTALITIHPESPSGTFEYVMANKPAEMSIIGGVSTYSLPGATSSDARPYDFADTAGWQFIADEAQHIVSVTGNNVIALENEVALQKFHRGAVIDLAKLAVSLTALRDTGIEFWWYLPSIQENSTQVPDLQQRSIDLIRTISTALPNCRFIVGLMGYLDWREDKRTEATRRQMMIDMLGQSRVLDFLIVTPDGYCYYDSTRRYAHTWLDAYAEMHNLPGVNQICITPGGKNWVTVSRQFAEN